jgi:hypothetical protein
MKRTHIFLSVAALAAMGVALLLFFVFVGFSHLSTIDFQRLQNWLPRLVLLQVLWCQRPAHS